MIELTEHHQQVFDSEPEPRLLDPRTNRAYVLVGAELYNRVKLLLADDDGLDMAQVGTLVERAMAKEDEGDPTLEYYQQTYGKSP